MKRLVLSLSVVAALGFVGAGASAPLRASPSLSSAGPFLLSELRDKLDGRWDRAWSSLTPLHQRLVPEQVYVRCERSTPFLARTVTLGVVRVRHARVSVPGMRNRLPGAAVTVRVVLSWYGPRDPIVITPTLHLVAVGGRWRWALSKQRYRLYTRRECGSLPPV